jgi:hypothetical protein
MIRHVPYFQVVYYCRLMNLCASVDLLIELYATFPDKQSH